MRSAAPRIPTITRFVLLLELGRAFGGDHEVVGSTPLPRVRVGPYLIATPRSLHLRFANLSSEKDEVEVLVYHDDSDRCSPLPKT